MTKNHMTCGFMFLGEHEAVEREKRAPVVLITKNRPEWQKGLLNGVGGHMEENESIIECMVREFEEETGWATEEANWKVFHRMSFENAVIHFCTAYTPKALPSGPLTGREWKAPFTSMTDEEVSMYFQEDLAVERWPTIPNLRWLVPMAWDLLHNRNALFAESTSRWYS